MASEPSTPRTDEDDAQTLTIHGKCVRIHWMVSKDQLLSEGWHAKPELNDLDAAAKAAREQDHKLDHDYASKSAVVVQMQVMSGHDKPKLIQSDRAKNSVGGQEVFGHVLSIQPGSEHSITLDDTGRRGDAVLLSQLPSCFGGTDAACDMIATTIGRYLAGRDETPQVFDPPVDYSLKDAIIVTALVILSKMRYIEVELVDLPKENNHEGTQE